MTLLKSHFEQVFDRIHKAESACQREGEVKLLAVSKTKPAEMVREACELGQREFGESYLQEALVKIDALSDIHDIVWHFIGPIQSNKTRDIASHFHWVHSVDRLKIAKRLNDQRPDELPPLNICLQVNISGEASKSGVTLDNLEALAKAVAELPNLSLRGLMAIPAPAPDKEQQRIPLRAMKQALETINQTLGLNMDTLSMGMTDDLEAAIEEGSTMVRIGTALFGARTYSNQQSR
ncbi:alanine racemase [Endozoicomonas montiporae]|uniref:Pyridoxal phosphate homeostasis protein n=2 Tax=Endozoicomonas montiporae TaxID=1027273 RepID=A0A081MZG6_9GAMM|nr:YggS family pyridoxal phosphate-dependent enzyme [Endozoicomonas montiporae]AMO54728.1 alanine racemase domain protein [Endozoicomonas montiporae CL-33]KEQ11589.1 alanine racemase [Endozoicomonas montiporae]